MAKLKYKPLKKLTVDIVDKLVIHHTISSLRRAADSKEMIRQDGDYNIPTIFHINEGSSWSLHAMIDDLCRFLLIGQVYTPEPEEPEKPVNSDPKIHSKIKWDRVTGGNRINDVVDGGILAITGEIDHNDEGKYLIGIEIIPDSKMIEYYPDATIQIYQQSKELVKDNLQDSILHPILEIRKDEDNEVGEIPITIEWSKDFIEHFSVGFPQGGLIFN
jgi:hypothetical protein